MGYRKFAALRVVPMLSVYSVILFVIPLLIAQRGVPVGSDREIAIMTWNTYLGAELEPALNPSLPPEQLAQVIAQTWAEVQSTNFPERADGIARQIEQVRPDILCLQEVALWKTGTFLDPEPATTVVYDFLQILLNSLESRHLEYRVVAVAQGTSVELPDVATAEDVRFTDRQAILVRSDLRTSDLKWSYPETGIYQTEIPLSILGQQVSIKRAWISLDVKVRGRSFRVITTQLESFNPGVQFAQAGELLSGPAATEQPVILAGDLNSPADETGTGTYDYLLNAGFEDVWQKVGVDDGLTCCQQSDLLNATSALSERIDFVLFRGDFTPVWADVRGDEQSDRTDVSALWPSDHAGVVSQLQFRKFE